MKHKCRKQKRVKNAAPRRVSLGTGLSVHLVKDVKMLKNVMDCDHVCQAVNNTMVKVTKVGSVELKTAVNGAKRL